MNPDFQSELFSRIFGCAVADTRNQHLAHVSHEFSCRLIPHSVQAGC